MRVLVLGGTSFVGRAIVEDALRSGFDVTLFSRGRTGRELFPSVPRLVGDRDTGDYTALADSSEWDAVIDVSGYVSRHVRQAMDVLGDRVGRYLFISSHAVYEPEGLGPGTTKDAPLRAARYDVDDVEELSEETYGPAKVACEEEVRARYGSHATIVRPGKVAGPHDPQQGLTYWVRRASVGGRIAMAADPEQPLQVVDVRNLASLVTRLITDDRPGAFHAVGPAEPIEFAGMIALCAEVAGAQAEIVPVPVDAFGRLMPLVRPRSQWSRMQRDGSRARAAGMPATPLRQTIADVLAWDRERGLPPLPGAPSAEEEERVLAELKR
jgi:2'-hydroxyisoflavone reductase